MYTFCSAMVVLATALYASAALIPISSSDPVNATIPAYIDPVLEAVAANPPTNVTQASVTFTNGVRSLPGAYFNFTEKAGLTSGNLTVVEILFAFPANLSTTNNIFSYHVHEKPVAAGDQACTSPGGHYDPFSANGTEGLVTGEGGLYNPNPGNLSTYQLGDLAGRWGAITTTNGAVSGRVVLDNYVRLSGNFSVLGRSIVIHDAPTNKRIACGNITLATFATNASNNSSSPGSSSGSNSGGSGSSSATVGLRRDVTAAGALAVAVAFFTTML